MTINVMKRYELKYLIDEDQKAFFQKALAVFGRLAPDGDVDKTGLVAFVAVDRETPVDGQTEFADGGAGRRGAKIGIPGEISHQKNFIERCHDLFPS